MTKKQCRAWGKILATMTGVAIAASVANVAVAQEPDSGAPAKGVSGSSVKPTISPDRKFGGNIGSAEGPVTVFVQFSGQGTFDATQPQAVKDGKEAPEDKSAQVLAQREAINDTASSVAGAAGATEKLYVTTNTIPGVAMTADAESIRQLAQRKDVVRITPIVPKSYANKGTDIDTEALNAWTQNHATGEGATIAVLDTGLDYTHADFGGPGTQEAYDEAQKSTEIPEKLHDPKKFVGGHDLVGDDYNADPKGKDSPYQPIPHPDNNPLDCAAAGHGSHVAGTAAGYGENADGTTFTGDYSKLTADQVNTMKIGPGSAPMAKLVSLRVFGCHGSSDVVGQALDFVLDPNGDGKFDDRANVVNMSLGSDWSPTDDPENDIVDNLAKQGVLSVVASGNAGDIYDVGGSPGNAKSALTVANSVGSTAPLDRIDVTAPADKAGQAAGQYSASFDYTKADPATLKGNVVYAPDGNLTGCTAFTDDQAAKFKDKWVMLEWDDNEQTRKCGSATRFNNAEKGGAKGVVFTSTLASFAAGIAGNATIPGVQLNNKSTDALKPAAQTGTLELKLDPAYVGTADGPSGALNTLNSSSSRGVHGSNGIVKPDVAAPGTSIASAGAGSGNGLRVMSGTSMATPHVAGIAALLYGEGNSKNTLNAYQVKSMIMSTSNVDILAGKTPYGPNRVGSGRVNAQDATSNSVYAFAKDDPALTSVNFGVVEVADKPVSVSKEVTLQGVTNDVRDFNLKYVPATEMPGVSFSVTPTARVGGKGTNAEPVVVTMTINDPKALAKTLDPTMSDIQLGVPRQFIADASGRIEMTSASNPTLHLPVYAAPKPVAAMAADNKVTFANNATETAVKLNGRGLNQGEGKANYTSVVAPLVLGASSDQKPDTAYSAITNKSMDLQYVGASSTVPGVIAAKGDPSKDGVVSFGVSTYGNWPSLLAASSIGVDIDTNADGKADFRMSTGVAAGLDDILVDTQDLNTGKIVDEQPANGVWGDVDTNSMDTNTITLPVLASALNLDLSKPAPISYKVITSSQYSIDDSGKNVPVDQTDMIKFDVTNPALWFTGDQPASLFVDAPDTTLSMHRAAEAGNTQALFLHLHNANMAKAQVVETEVNKLRFSDVPPGTMFEGDINWMADQGLTTGYPDGTYRPLDTMHRDAMAAFLYRLAGQPAFNAPIKSPFADITPDTQFYKEMTWMEATGLSTGYQEADGSKTFRPLTNLNRDAMSAFLYRFAGDNYCKIGDTQNYTAPTAAQFKDVDMSNQFFKEISWAKDKGITTGYPDGTFRPLDGMHRDAMAAFVHRLDTYEHKNGGCNPGN